MYNSFQFFSECFIRIGVNGYLYYRKLYFISPFMRLNYESKSSSAFSLTICSIRSFVITLPSSFPQASATQE